jgi:hypothetical protein
VDQIALVNVLASAQSGTPHAAAIEDMGEAGQGELVLRPDLTLFSRPDLVKDKGAFGIKLKSPGILSVALRRVGDASDGGQDQAA